MFGSRTWKIEIRWDGGRCSFGKGWLVFTKEAELQADNTLILFASGLYGINYINVVIFKAEDNLVDTCSCFLIHNNYYLFYE